MHPPGDETDKDPRKDSRIDWARLDRFVSGEGSPDERAALQAWVDGDPIVQALAHTLRTAQDLPGEPPRNWDAGGAWDAVLRRTARPPRSARHLGFPQSIRVRAAAGAWPRRFATGVAACLIAAIAAVSTWQLTLHGSRPSQFREFASAAASRTTVTLRDGSRLILGPATHLRVPADFGESARTVDLDGEASFAVVHDPRHPFAVHTAHVVARDIGTTFVVRAYDDDPDARVAVLEGEVAVDAAQRGGSGAHTEYLGAASEARVAPDGSLTVRHGVSLAADVAWVQGGLAFADTPLGDAVRELERAFDVEITVADSGLLAQPITASFSQEPVDQVLEAVTLAVGAQYERVGRRVVIRRRAAGARRPIEPAALPIARLARATGSAPDAARNP